MAKKKKKTRKNQNLHKVIISNKKFGNLDNTPVYLTDDILKNFSKRKTRSGAKFIELFKQGRAIKGFKHLLEQIKTKDKKAALVLTSDSTKKQGSRYFINCQDYVAKGQSRFLSFYRATGLDVSLSYLNAYFPKDFSSYFDQDINLIDWLRLYSEDKNEGFIRSFLGKVLFSGDDALKNIQVLSGGEKVRCMLAKIMLTGANVIILDEPTNHLDLESIIALNKGLARFQGTLLLATHDHQIIQTVANRIVEFSDKGIIDKPGYSLDEYLEDKNIKQKRISLGILK